MKSLISIGEAALILGVSISTLRRWHKDNKLTPKYITIGGHRRYCLNQLNTIINTDSTSTNRINIGYARVSSSDQKKDLETQKQRLLMQANQYDNFEIISDLGSGLNYKKKGLKKLINLICNREVKTLIIVHKDRLLRFGSELLFNLCDFFGTEVIILEKKEMTFEKELVEDVLELMTVFSARLYGKRSHKNKKKVVNAA